MPLQSQKVCDPQKLGLIFFHLNLAPAYLDIFGPLRTHAREYTEMHVTRILAAKACATL